MPVTIEKEWAAVDGDEIVMKAETERELKSDLERDGLDIDEYEIVALPKSHSSMFI